MAGIYGDEGSTGNCGSNRGWEDGTLLSQNYQVPEAGRITHVSAWIHDNTGTMRGDIWANGADVPEALLGQSNAEIVPDVNGVRVFYTFELIAPVDVEEDEIIWIGFVSSPEVYSCDDGASPTGTLGGRRILSGLDPNDPMPDPAGTTGPYSASRPIQYTLGDPVIPSNQGAAPIVMVII